MIQKGFDLCFEVEVDKSFTHGKQAIVQPCLYDSYSEMTLYRNLVHSSYLR